MHNFFVTEDCREGDSFVITGPDCNHIINVLRMKKGDSFFVSCEGQSHLCVLDEGQQDFVRAVITEENCNDTELSVKIYLFQGLPKSDKMELIIQKTTELGVYEIIPTEMNRCVVKLDEKKKKSKIARWQSIAESAAKQSKRNFIPKVSDVLSYTEALKKAGELDLVLVPYENERGMVATKEALMKIRKGSSVGVFIGSEGGFEEYEIEKAISCGAVPVSLGRRILRTETAAITSVGMCMLYAEMETEGESNG